MAEFKSRISLFENSIWGLYIPVPENEAGHFLQSNNRRVVCTLNEQVVMHAAILPNKGLWYILLNKGVCQKLKVKAGDELLVRLEPELSQYGMPMPEELEICLWQEEGAMTFFEALTPGKQRSLIYIISKIKSQDTRIRKSWVIAQHLAESRGLLDYKRLNEMFKEAGGRTRF